MKATTVWSAYRQARALSNRDVYDRRAWRITVACMKRLERICQEHEAMKDATAPPEPRDRALREARDAYASSTIDTLRQALDDYGQHNAGCSARFGPTYCCDCGWREVAAALGVREGPK